MLTLLYSIQLVQSLFKRCIRSLSLPSVNQFKLQQRLKGVICKKWPESEGPKLQEAAEPLTTAHYT